MRCFWNGNSSDVQQIGMSFTWKQVVWCRTIQQGTAPDPWERVKEKKHLQYKKGVNNNFNIYGI